jgi:hypothetical protein
LIALAYGSSSTSEPDSLEAEKAVPSELSSCRMNQLTSTLASTGRAIGHAFTAVGTPCYARLGSVKVNAHREKLQTIALVVLGPAGMLSL